MPFAIKSKNGDVKEIAGDDIVVSTDEECIDWLNYLAGKYELEGADLEALHAALYFCEAEVEDDVIFGEPEIMGFAALIRTCAEDAMLVRACLDHIMESVEYEADMDDLPLEHITNMALLYTKMTPTPGDDDDDDDEDEEDEEPEPVALDGSAADK